MLARGSSRQHTAGFRLSSAGQTSLVFSDEHLVTDELEVDEELDDVQDYVEVPDHVAHGLRRVVVEHEPDEHEVQPQPHLERVVEPEALLPEPFVLEVVPDEDEPVHGEQEDGLVVRAEDPIERSRTRPLNLLFK